MIRLFSVLVGCLSLGAGLALALFDPFEISSLTPKDESRFKQRMWDADYFTNARVVTHDGKELRFYDDLLKGKIVVINFIYTSCRDVCSLATARLAQVREKLGDRVGRDVFFYSITLDPEMDGPEVLQKYAKNFHSGPGWLFLTGKPDDISLIRHKLGERSKALSEHRNDVLLGNATTGEWGRDSIFSDAEHLAHNILRMDPREREKPTMKLVNTNSSGAPGSLGQTPGRALFAKACTACHRIGGGDHIGPDLAGVGARRSHDWLVRFIVSPGQMLAAGDPTAMSLLQRFGGLRMPELGLTEKDAEDVIAFIKSREMHADGENVVGAVDQSEARGAPLR
jgi:protein SCO1/2